MTQREREIAFYEYIAEAMRYASTNIGKQIDFSKYIILLPKNTHLTEEKESLGLMFTLLKVCHAVLILRARTIVRLMMKKRYRKLENIKNYIHWRPQNDPTGRTRRAPKSAWMRLTQRSRALCRVGI